MILFLEKRDCDIMIQSLFFIEIIDNIFAEQYAKNKMDTTIRFSKQCYYARFCSRPGVESQTHSEIESIKLFLTDRDQVVKNIFK